MYKEFDKRVDEILANLTLKQKIGQLNQVQQPFNTEQAELVKKWIKEGLVGSIIQAGTSTAGNDGQDGVRVDEFNEFQRIAVEESDSGIPLIFGRDVIHGHYTVMPIPLAGAAAFNPEITEKAYRCVAKEAAADNIHWTFSPMMDICTDPRWGRIIEGAGEDPFLASRVAEATIKGFQGDDLSDENSLAACAKHYLGYGFSEGGRDYHRTEISDYTLYNKILPPFRASVAAGVATVMSSFNDINGQPVTSSKKYLTDILRGKFGFDGFVVTDWATVSRLVNQGVCENVRDSAKAAINAGVDMDMVSKIFMNELESLVLSGEVSEDIIDEAVRRVLRIKIAKGLFERPYCAEREIDMQEHIAVSREFAAESMVLLKNNGVLPLKNEGTVALAGPMLRVKRELLGTWVLDGKADIAPSFLEAFSSVAGENIKIITDKGSMVLDDSLESFYNSDVIVLALGESHEVTGEARSVADISISKSQVELAKWAKSLGKKTVGVLFCGRPLALSEIEPYLDGILCAWHCGTETATAAAEILLGKRVPCGKTPVTFPRCTGQIPIYYNSTVTVSGVCGYYGQAAERNYCDMLGTPLYPFGFGLSYTKFNISAISCNKTEIPLVDIKNGESFVFSVDVANIGEFDGKETVQLYIRDKISSIMRPVRELKGFEKVLIKKGETANIEFNIGKTHLGFYGNNGEYLIEKGEFDIFVGGNCLTNNKITVKVI
ncbi:MAG: glycoside hydrolase family 3 C-terminal domain-containing protein [Clostridia bacterium]|nr:glycoside hydrolase family 3 C-terminal domain-containing protein [Clostridia bacterium]